MSFESRWRIDVEWPASGAQDVYDLSHPLHTGIPHHPAHPPYAFSLTKRHGEAMYPEGVSAAAEMITTGGHVGTHIDGFAHISRLGKIYGGLDVFSSQSYADGVLVQSVHEMQPVLGPAHLVDLTVLHGRDLTPDDGVTAAEFDAWFTDHPAPRSGSIVLVRTGWDRYWEDNATFLGTQAGAPGVTLSGARWLTDRHVSATGADTISYEKMPAAELPVHCHLLVDSGVPIMEAMNLEPLARAGIWDFFFTAAPLPIRGGTGSPIRPLAFVSRTS
jgi:kynurenine formamidase